MRAMLIYETVVPAKAGAYGDMIPYMQEAALPRPPFLLGAADGWAPAFVGATQRSGAA